MQMPSELSLHTPASCQDILMQNYSAQFFTQPPAYVYSGNIKTIDNFAVNVHYFCGWIAQLCHIFIK